MDLYFGICHQKLIFINNKKYLVEKSNNYLRLFFTFKTKDWKNVRKFIILKDNDKKSYQFYTDEKGIVVPSTILNGDNFYVTVYGIDYDDNRITTNELKINLVETGYTKDISKLEEDESKDIFMEMEEVINKISDVGKSGEYSDLLNIPNEFNPLQHTHTTDEITDISDVGATGNYEDLLDIPTEFNPIQHTHTTDEITDFSEKTVSEIKASYRQLANRIRTSN